MKDENQTEGAPEDAAGAFVGRRPGSIHHTFKKAKDVIKICQVVDYTSDECGPIVILCTVLDGEEYRVSLPVEFLPAGTVKGKHVMVICSLAG